MLCALFVAWMYSYGVERRAVEDLRPDERVAVYEEALKEFEALCVPPGRGLAESCRKRARHLGYFPECDSRCHEIIRSWSEGSSSGSSGLGRYVLAIRPEEFGAVAAEARREDRGAPQGT